MTRDHVRRLAQSDLSLTEIAATLAIAKSTVCYHLRCLGIAPDARFARRYDWSSVRRYYEEGHTVRDCQRRFGFTGSAWAEAVRRGDVTPRSRRAELELVTDRGDPVSRGSLKAALVREGIKDGSCERCGLREWRSRPLALSLHHMNGDPRDNRLDNLQLLCPNCHSQTDSYGGRNNARSARPNADATPSSGAI